MKSWSVFDESERCDMRGVIREVRGQAVRYFVYSGAEGSVSLNQGGPIESRGGIVPGVC